MTLQANLNAALAAVTAVRNLGLQSNNRGVARDGLSAELSATRGDFSNFLYRCTYSGMLDDLKRDPEPPGLQTFVVPAQVARRLGFGNCEARAALALIHVARHTTIRPLELFSIGDDHVILVIGRTDGAANVPADWNADAVICDAWAEIFYAKGELAIQMAVPALRDVVGEDWGLSQTFEHTAVAWPPAALDRFMAPAGLNDIWP